MEKINKILVVIPARLGSKRLPGKPLINVNGKPLIQYVYEGCLKSKLADKVIVATDSQEIVDCVNGFNGEVMLTSFEHKTGSDRVAEVAEKMLDYSIIAVIQGDSPLVNGELVDLLVKPLIENSEIQMTALKSKITNNEELENPNIVKVVTNKDNFALYYSRFPIPYDRENLGAVHYKNKGVYGFKRDFLLQYVKIPQQQLEKSEFLEQLRALENGIKIYVQETDIETFDVNVPEDVEVVEKKLMERELEINGER